MLSLSLSLAAMAAVAAGVAGVAGGGEPASCAGLVGMRLCDADDGVCAEIVSVDTAPSRGDKFGEARATCVELGGNMGVPGCATTATGKVSHAQHFTQLFCTLTLIPLLLN